MAPNITVHHLTALVPLSTPSNTFRTPGFWLPSPAVPFVYSDQVEGRILDKVEGRDRGVRRVVYGLVEQEGQVERLCNLLLRSEERTR